MIEDWSPVAWIVICAIPVGLVMISIWTGTRGSRAMLDKPSRDDPRDPL
ncbi:hypothetical protein AB6806_28115 [Bosea sp. RCC_152_1]